MSFGLLNTGFRRKRYADIKTAMDDRAIEYFGDNVNLGPASPLGMIIRIVAWSMSTLWASAEATYHAGYVDTAEDVHLDGVGKYIGIIRRDAVAATGIITITGDPGTFIPAGFLLLSTTNNVEYVTVEAVTIPDVTVDVGIQATVAGSAGNSPAWTVTEIVNPIAGVSDVTNGDPVDGGLDRETDEEFRVRYDASVSTAGASTVESITAAILAVEGVRDAVVGVNDTLTEPPPAKSILPLVYGGDAAEVANAIYQTKAAGIQCHGDDETEIIEGITISFDRPDFITIEVFASLGVDGDFPGVEPVRTEIIRYIGGVDDDGIDHLGISLGADVIYTRLIAAIHNVPGIVDIVMDMNRAGEIPGPGNITMASDEKAVTSTIDVVVVTI